MLRRDLFEASKRKKKRRLIIRFLLLLFAVAVVIVIIIWSFYFDYFRIKNIAVEGNSFIEKEKIIGNINNSISGKYFYIIPKNNILIASKKEIADNLLNNFFRVKSADISKKLPDGLMIKIEERNPSALLCEDKNCFFVDDSGYVFEESPFFSGDIFIKFIDQRNERNFSANTKILSEEEFKNLVNFSELLSKDGIRISGIILKNEGLYEFHISEQWYILLSQRSDYKISFDNLKIALNEQIKEKRPELEYVDIRLQNKVFFKYR